MSKKIVAFDVETTGLDTQKDYIIQLAGVKFDSEDFEIIEEFNAYVLPNADFEISEGAFEKHQISKEFLERNGKPMQEVGSQFLEFIEGCDMLSYNGNSFDIKMLSKDLRLNGMEISLDRVWYDSLSLEKILMPRKLENVYERYTGMKLENGHNALFDVRATIEIFARQLDAFQQQDITLDQIMEFDESKIFCIDGMIKKDGEKILFAKGKYKDTEFMEVAKQDVSYIKWFMNNPGFDINTKNILKEYYAKNR